MRHGQKKTPAQVQYDNPAFFGNFGNGILHDFAHFERNHQLLGA
jgi:hypothetical protein